MVSWQIDKVELAWADNGNKMWSVYLSNQDGLAAYYRTWGIDEIDAYMQIKKLVDSKEQKNGYRL